MLKKTDTAKVNLNSAEVLKFNFKYRSRYAEFKKVKFAICVLFYHENRFVK